MALMTRRAALAQIASLFAAPAIIRFNALMPISVSHLNMNELMVYGINMQSWPFGSQRPDRYMTGMLCGYTSGLQPPPTFTRRLDSHKELWPDLVWKAIPPLPRSLQLAQDKGR